MPDRPASATHPDLGPSQFTLKEMFLWTTLTACALAAGFEWTVAAMKLVIVLLAVGVVCKAYRGWVRRSCLSPAETHKRLRAALVRIAAGLALGFLVGLFVAPAVVASAQSRLTPILTEFYAQQAASRAQSPNFSRWPGKKGSSSFSASREDASASVDGEESCVPVP